MSHIIEIEGLEKRYGDFRLEIPSFQIEAGTVTGLVGANGAGKSTTLKLLLNLIRRDAGGIRIFGMDNVERENDIKQEIGVVFDEPCFHDLLSPRNIGRVMREWYKNWDDGQYTRLLDRFSLPPNKPVKEFSRGMKMKLSIAAAMCHHPKLLILDEPTGGLDPLVRDEILDMFLEFLQDESRSILLSSHITSDLDKIADTIALLDKGRLVFHKEKDALLDSYAVVKGGNDQLALLSEEKMIGLRRNRFGFEALCRRDAARKYPQLAAEHPTIEEIMLFFTKGKMENQERTDVL